MAERKRSTNALLRALSSEELIHLVMDLHKAVPAARRIIDARLLGANPVDLAEFKKEISAGLYPDVMKDKPIDIRRARKAVSDFKKACGAGRELADLMLYYAEVGTEFAVDYGADDERLYASLCSMLKEFEEVYQALPKEDQDLFNMRIAELVDAAGEVAWEYGDFLYQKRCEMVSDAEE